MRIVSISDIRQDATRLINEAGRTHTPLLVIQRSRPTAYVVLTPEIVVVEHAFHAAAV
jgi:prevent-host-death family protein